MRMDQFTVKAQEAITAAQTQAEKSDHPEVTPEHLLRAMVGQEGGVVPAALGKMSVPTAPILQDLDRATGALPRTQGAATQISPRLDAVLKGALREAEALKDQYVSTEHLLLALIDAKTIAMVGASSNPDRPSHGIMRKLQSAGYRVIPVNPNETTVLGERAYRSLADVHERIDIVDVFRRAEFTPAVADEAVKAGAKALWLQSGVRNDVAAAKAEAGGLTVVMDACIGSLHAILQVPKK